MPKRRLPPKTKPQPDIDPLAESTKVLIQLQSAEGDTTGPNLSIPLAITPKDLEILLNQLLQNDDPVPYSFYVKDKEITTNLDSTVEELQQSTEEVLTVVYQPQALFKVQSVTRCSASISGHAEAVLSVAFSPDGTSLASGSGDTTVRIWDIYTQTPEFTCKGHTNWVLCIAWSPDGKYLASGSMDNTVRLWDPKTGEAIGGALTGHTKWITCLAWEPLHINGKCNRLASSSKDGTVRIWDLTTRRMQFALGQHTDAVTCVVWGGEGLIYTSSRDRTIKCWDAKDGKLCRTLSGHAHWVNTLALNTGYVLRTGAYDHTGARKFASEEEAQQLAKKRYQAVRDVLPEMLLSGSDDFTMFLWQPGEDKKPVARLTGHQQLINHVCFSPDGRLVASASFDKSVRLWDGRTGKFISALRAHVGSVYQVAWSADSRLLVSSSKDSTLKVWDLKTHKLKFDLPGHADEVYAVDWSPDGERVASGGKDKVLKMWCS